MYDREEIEQTEEGTWQLADSVEEIGVGLPDSIKGLITRKIGQLSDGERRGAGGQRGYYGGRVFGRRECPNHAFE